MRIDRCADCGGVLSRQESAKCAGNPDTDVLCGTCSNLAESSANCEECGRLISADASLCGPCELKTNGTQSGQFVNVEEDSIELFRGSDAWYARSIGAEAGKTRELFGTDTLPTAFTAQASPEVVLAEVSKLNPNMRVFLRAEVK